MNIATNTISEIDLVNLANDLAQTNLGYLGLSITILVILGGAFAYFNINPFKDSLNKQEEKINELKKEADKLLKSTEEKVGVTLKIFGEAQGEKLSAFAEQNREYLLLELQKGVTDLEKNIYEKIENITESKDNKLREIILSEVDNRIRTLEKNLNVNGVRNEIKELKREVKELMIYKYAQEGKMGAIIYSIDLLKEDIDEKEMYDWRIPGRLEELRKNVDGVDLDANYISQIEDQLSRIENEKKYRPLIELVRKQYSQKETGKSTGSKSDRDA